MANLRQYVEGFYANECQLPRSSFMRKMFLDLVSDVERRLTITLFDMNRTLATMQSTRRRTVTVDCIHQTVFDHALKAKFGGSTNCECRTLQDTLRVIPAHALVRKHPAGDYSLIVPWTIALEDQTLENLVAQAKEDGFQGTEITHEHKSFFFLGGGGGDFTHKFHSCNTKFLGNFLLFLWAIH